MPFCAKYIASFLNLARCETLFHPMKFMPWFSSLNKVDGKIISGLKSDWLWCTMLRNKSPGIWQANFRNQDAWKTGSA